MYVDPIVRFLVMALNWNYLVDYCKDYIMMVVVGRVGRSLMDHVLAWGAAAAVVVAAADRAFDHPDLDLVLVRDDTSGHHNLVSAIDHHCWFLHCCNMDPRWNFLGYQNIVSVMGVAVRIVSNKFWLLNRPC